MTEETPVWPSPEYFEAVRKRDAALAKERAKEATDHRVPAARRPKKSIIIRERQLARMRSEMGHGRAELVGMAKDVVMIVDALATLIKRSKEENFQALRSIGPMTPEDMRTYDELAKKDLLSFTVSDRQLLSVLKFKDPIHGWQIENVIIRLLGVYAMLDENYEFLTTEKRQHKISGWAMPIHFLRDLKITYKGVLSHRKNVTDPRNLVEHEYELVLGGMGLGWLSNLIQKKPQFLLNDIAIQHRLSSPAFLIWNALECFKGKPQHQTLEFFERVLALKETDWRSTGVHIRTVSRALTQLQKEGLIREWKMTGRGRATVFRIQ